MPAQAENPYSAPESQVRDSFVEGDAYRLAPRMTRLGAVLLDGVFGFIIGIPALIGLAMDPDMEGGMVVGLFAITGLLGIAFFIYQLILLAQNGWTLGKKMLRIRIVRTDGRPAGLGRIFWLRMMLNGLIASIPIIGSIYGLVDPLFIFGENQRCLHDYIADTIVVNA